MIKRLIPALMLLHSPLVADQVYQQEGYFGIQYNLLNQETDFEDIEPAGFQTRFGVQVNPFVGLEGRLGYGIDDDSLDAGGASFTLDPEWLVGAYVKVGLDSRQPVAPYVLLGHSTAQAEITTETTSSTLFGSETARTKQEVTASDPSYGVGVEVNLSETAALHAEWVQLDDDDDFDLTTINLGFISRF